MIVFNILVAVSTAVYLAGIVTCWRHINLDAVVRLPVELPPLTIIAPLAGLEEEMEENLAALFGQEYGAQREIIFSSASASDPALALARCVAERFPHVHATFVTAPEFGLNPEVRNMAAALEAARFNLVFHSDANTRLRPGMLSYIVGEFVASRAGILTCPVIGIGERSLWAAVENAQLTTFVAPAMCFANGPCRQACVVGKAMLFRLSELRSLGGLECVKDLLAHDYVLGRIYARAGLRVVLSRLPIQNVNVDRSARSFFERHIRWLKMRLVARPVGWVLDLVANPPLLALVAVVASRGEGGSVALLGLVWAGKVAIDFMTARRLRGEPLRRVSAFLLRDLALPLAAAASLGRRSIEWRGHRLYVGRGTRLRLGS